MENFKGSKGNWKRVKLQATDCYPQRNEIHYGNSGECVAEFISDDYDALLISKAPEMLEALQECLDTFTCEDSVDSGLKIKIQSLIKSATEL